jgi:hypothetical protein
MQINREDLDRLLSLNDRQLKTMVSRIIAQSGIDPAQFNIDPDSIRSIRAALSSASDEDLPRIAEQYTKKRNGRG